MGFWAAVPSIASFGSSLLGGGSDTWQEHYDNVPQGFACPGAPSEDAIERAVRAMPDADITTITTALKQYNDGLGPSSREELAQRGTMYLWVTKMFGGSDCFVKTESAKWMPSWLQEKVKQYGGNELNPTGVNLGTTAPSSASSDGTGVVGGLSDPAWLTEVQRIINKAQEAVDTVSNEPSSTPTGSGAVLAGFSSIPPAVWIGAAGVAAVLILKR